MVINKEKYFSKKTFIIASNLAIKFDKKIVRLNALS